MNETRRHWLLAAMAAVAAGATGTAWAQGAELTVGVFNATTGVYAFGGVPIQNAMRLAIEQANKQGLPGGATFRQSIYHSHSVRGSYFSGEDRARAMFGDDPAYPDVTYVVVSDAREPDEARAFRWDDAAQDFVETPIEVREP